MERSVPTSAFIKVDFPTLGFPIIEIKPEWCSFFCSKCVALRVKVGIKIGVGTKEKASSLHEVRRSVLRPVVFIFFTKTELVRMG